MYPDAIADCVRSGSNWWGKVDRFLEAFKVTIYLLRLVDNGTPCLGKVYYCCCLADKALRLHKEFQTTSSFF